MVTADARRFRTGRLCLDFLHTGGDGLELLQTPADVAHWLAFVAGLPRVAATGVDLVPAHELRRVIRRGVGRAMDGRAVAVPDRLALNTAAAEPPPVPVLHPDGTSGLRLPVGAPAVLSLLARDAVDLLGGPLARQVRVCAAQGCGLLLLDRSPTGTRQWCSMQRCGTVSKVRAHRRRTG